VRAALQALKGQKNARLTFAPGRHDFWPDRAVEEYLFVSNNEESLKRIAFAIDGCDGLEIDGQGAQFVFHGLISPFSLRDSRNVRLANFAVDWGRTFHSEAQILAASGVGNGRDRVDLEIGEAFPYVIKDEKLLFTGEGEVTYLLGNALEFDPNRRETAFGVFDNFGFGNGHRATEIGSRRVRLEAKFNTLPTPGNVLALIDGMRYCPAISAANCRQIAVENVAIYHCGGMGFIAQNCRDIQIRELRVVPAPDSGRLISISADATHFVNCSGHIEMENCRFENQLDDATNVHGIYAQISRRVSDREIEVKLMHPQQGGVPVAVAGNEVGFVNNQTLATYHVAPVEGVERLNKTYSILRFAAPLPPEVAPGHAVENHAGHADVTIRGCVARGNRARGFLLSTPGKVLIENNRFHTPGAAILIAGDANYWFESGAVRDVTIRGNHFDNCLYGVWGRAVIDICPEIGAHQEAAPPYHSNITIAENRFCALDSRLLRADSVDGLTVRDNQIEPSDDYPVQPPKSEPFVTDDCCNVVIENNSFAPVAK
jgi:hypothetical protein